MPPTGLLIDEPLSKLDAKLLADMRTQIKRLHKMLATTTIYVTHDQVEAFTGSSPADVYARPNSLFVGAFIGSPHMNMLKARVDRSNGAVTVRLGNFSVPLADVDAADGAEVVLGVRPEHLQVCAPEATSLLATVDVSSRSAPTRSPFCLREGQEITARLDPELVLTTGERINFAVDMRRVHLFDTDNGQRLAFTA